MLSFTSRSVNFGTQISFFEFCVPAGRCLSSRSQSTLAHKSVFSSFVCQPGAVSQVSRGQFWHTNRLFRVLCARPALPPEILEGKNEKFLAHKSPKLEIVCHSSSIPPKKWKNFGTQIAQIEDRVPHLLKPPKENEKFLAHKLPKFEIVCHSSQTSEEKWAIKGTGGVRVWSTRDSTEQDAVKTHFSRKQEKSLLRLVSCFLAHFGNII